MNKILFFVLLLVSPTVLAYDEVCGDKCLDRRGELPTCEDLGYTLNKFCPEGYVTCPLDDSYIWCKDYNCAMGGFLEENEISAKKAAGYLCYKLKFHGLTCYDCDEIDKGRCIYDDTNIGEGVLTGTRCPDGTWTGCAGTCASKSITIPDVPGVVPVISSCTSCGVREPIIVDFECQANYVKEDGTCKPKGCPDSYTAGLEDCSEKAHQEGWSYKKGGQSGNAVCGKCTPKSCPVGFDTGVSCPNGTGYNYEEQGFSGDEACGRCSKLDCLSPYNSQYQSIEDCPALEDPKWSYSKAWTYSQSDVSYGDSACGLCSPKSCTGNYYSIYQSLRDCPNDLGYTWEYDENQFYGNKYCGRCVEKQCSQGYRNLMLEDCMTLYGYPSLEGVSLSETGEYSAFWACRVCQCDTSQKCQYKAENIGDGGEGVGVCCDGVSYLSCKKKESCDGVEAAQIQHATQTSACNACGHTYLKVVSCEDGYRPAEDGKSCVQKRCEDWNLVSPSSSCPDGYGHKVSSSEHPGCYSCEASTCESSYGDTWHLDSGSATCEDGYQITYKDARLGEVERTCYNCDSCRKEPGYITVSSIDKIPSYVSAKELIKSCQKYQYCATSCADGYKVKDCGCSPNECPNYTEQTDLVKINATTYTDYVHNYDVCRRGGSLVYKAIGCAEKYGKVTCSLGGQTRIGATKDSYECYKCECNNVSAECPYHSENIGAGSGVGPCCDDSFYQGCERDLSLCNYTLTEEPLHASTKRCRACNQWYYQVESCESGYKGEDCSQCDTDEGFALCGDTCSRPINCGTNKEASCVDGEWQC